MHCGPTPMAIPLFVVHNIHVYVGIPSYLKETFEAHKVGLTLQSFHMVCPEVVGAVQSVWSTFLPTGHLR